MLGWTAKDMKGDIMAYLKVPPLHTCLPKQTEDNHISQHSQPLNLKLLTQKGILITVETMTDDGSECFFHTVNFLYKYIL
jgi:hypothetical protein